MRKKIEVDGVMCKFSIINENNEKEIFQKYVKIISNICFFCEN